MTMKKENLVLKAAVAMAFGVASYGAQATQVTTGTLVQNYATELFNGSTPNTVALTLPQLNIVASTPLTGGAAGTNYVIFVQTAGAAWNSAPVLVPAVPAATISTGSISAVVFSSSQTSAVTSTGAGSANADFITYSFSIAAGQQITAGTVIGTLTGATVSNAGTALAAGTPVTVAATVQNTVPGFPTALGTATKLSAANIVDATSTPVNVAASALGISSTVAASTNAGQIDLGAASGSATKFNATAATTTQILLGTFKFTNGSALQASGANYVIAGGDTLTGTVTAPAGFFAPLSTAGKFWVTTAATTCAVAAPGAGATNISQSTTFTTAALAAAATSVALASTGAFPPVSATTYHLCMSVNGTVAISPGTPSATFTLVKAAGTAVDSNDVIASTAMWPLVYNAQVRDVINYVPAAVGGGWTQYLRIVNTGSVAAPVSASIINEAGGTGAVGTAVVLIPSLPAAAAMNIVSSCLESGVGCPTGVTTTGVGPISSTARPRIRISAPTDNMQVQNMLFTPATTPFTNNSTSQ